MEGSNRCHYKVLCVCDSFLWQLSGLALSSQLTPSLNMTEYLMIPFNWSKKMESFLSKLLISKSLFSPL